MGRFDNPSLERRGGTSKVTLVARVPLKRGLQKLLHEQTHGTPWPLGFVKGILEAISGDAGQSTDSLNIECGQCLQPPCRRRYSNSCMPLNPL